MLSTRIEAEQCLIVQLLFSFEGSTFLAGGNDAEDPPVPIPNTVVKLSDAYDTWRATAWENGVLPALSFESDIFYRSLSFDFPSSLPRPSTFGGILVL